MKLPKSSRRGTMSVERALATRRSVREFADEPLTPAELSQLLWAAQGVTDPDEGLRTCPSAGALYPLELYVAVEDGLFRYDPAAHDLLRDGGVALRDVRRALARAALRQECVARAPAVFLIAAVYRRSRVKYGSRARLYAWLEAGHAAQNLLLQAVALGLAAVPVAAFHDDELRAAAGLPRDHRPLYLVPIGRPR